MGEPKWNEIVAKAVTDTVQEAKITYSATGLPRLEIVCVLADEKALNSAQDLLDALRDYSRGMMKRRGR